MFQRFMFSVFLVGVLSAFGPAQVWYVHPSGSDIPDGSQLSPFSTIEQALGAVQDADTLILMPGVYTGAGNYDIVLPDITLTIRSAEPENWGIVAQTIIDPDSMGGIFVLENGQGIVTFEGITFQNAVKQHPPYDYPHGAAIFCDNTPMVIRYCRFLDCQADLGGALYFAGSQVLIQNTVLAGNEGWNGGALISDLGSDVQMDHCTVVGNQAKFFGGGILCEFESTLQIQNSIIWGNTLSEITGRGFQVALGEESDMFIEYTAIEGGIEGIWYNGTSIFTQGDGIMDADPLFAEVDLQESALLWDIHLQSTWGRWDNVSAQWISDTQTSPCIDAGSPDADYNGESWPNGRRANMGAFGNTAQASRFGNIADLDVDGQVDGIDLARLAAVWMDAPADFEDFDDNGIVGLTDFAVLAANWLWQMP
jgi:hypothetical protein